MLPGTYDFSVVRGSVAAMREQSPLVMRFKLFGETFQYDNVVLSIYDKTDELKGTLILRTDMLTGTIIMTDEYSGEVAWMVTAEQSRLLKVGAKSFYEVEVRYGGNEAPFLKGTITGIGGLNSDVEV